MRAATYARFSTENQREASIVDQQRECARLALRLNATVVAEFSDAAQSGGTAQRHGYQAMLTAARAKEFDVVIAEDVSRLWRNLAEQAPRLAELADLGIHVITHDLDTRQESATILAAVLGAGATAYRQEISRRTRRGMEGKALAGQSTGGRCYGYRTATSVDPGEASVVRRIFERRAAGASLYRIAEDLNAERVPAPRGGYWGQATLKRLLANARYTGAVEWGRTMVHPSAVDSRRKTHLMRPGGPVVSTTNGALQIIPEDLYRKVAI